jgi:aspartate carbamoyltransferase catalytic subunit
MGQLASRLQQLKTDEAIGAIPGHFLQQDVVSLDQFSVYDLHRLFTLAREMKQLVVTNQPSSLLAGCLVSLLFFEPSSRTYNFPVRHLVRQRGHAVRG